MVGQRGATGCQLIPIGRRWKRDAFGETPEQVLADAGYCSEPNLQVPA